MGKTPCCEKNGLNRGKWTLEEDEKLINYIKANGDGSWRSLPQNAGLLRCGKSCRLRWINYLRDDVKRGNFTEEEEETIVKLHKTLGNKWSLIASSLPGRTDNEIKNYWNSHLSRKIYRFKSFGQPTIASVDMLNMAKTSKRRAGRVSRVVAKKYINSHFMTRMANPEKDSNSVLSKQTTEQVGRNYPSNTSERNIDPLDCREKETTHTSPNENNSFSTDEWSNTSILSPYKEGRDTEMLGPWEEMNASSSYGEDAFISERTDKVLMDVDWSSNSEAANLYGCCSPINSYFNNDDLFSWNLDGAGNEPTYWSEEEDMLIWS